LSIHESGENYLEEIFILSEKKEKVRAVDLCAVLGFSRPTVSVMLRQLREDGFVAVAENGGLVLTEKGEAVARRVYERHCIIAQLLMALGVSREVAMEDACKIEHDISDETFLKLRAYVEKTQ
jgi:Mn-dependent DtxR family transcriptional regulator